jgi:HD-GYP domain-containing protein (c-di-GMP phosphodiesterase class II)
MTDAGRVLQALSLSRQSHSLYMAGHPARQESVRSILDEVRTLQSDQDDNPVLFVGPRGFHLGPSLLPRPSLTHLSLHKAFVESGIDVVEFHAGVTEDSIDGLVQMLAGDLDPRTKLPGITLNGMRPKLEERGDEGSGMKELLQSYAGGLELMRETGERVSNGQSADIGAASRVTESLADQIVRDPAQALLLTTIKSYDEYTYYHMVNVCILSLSIGHALGLPRHQVAALGLGGLLHDIGKILVPREILQQAGPLDEEQWRILQRHPVVGAGLVLGSAQDLAHPSLSMILEHHAAYDGAGYPDLARGRPPTLAARIVAVADCFDALTSKRAYRKAEERRQALNIIQASAGRGYDPRVVRVFVRLLGLFPMGSLLRLSSGEVGVVVRNHDELLARPTVRLILDRHGGESGAEERDLAERTRDGSFRWRIERSIDPSELDLDMLSLFSAGRLEQSPEDMGPGLMHEPAHGEVGPPGYVEAHDEAGTLPLTSAKPS